MQKSVKKARNIKMGSKKSYVDYNLGESHRYGLKFLFRRLVSKGNNNAKMLSRIKGNSKQDRNIKLKYKNIFIVTYGRSGSTLLQGILNSIEGCLIRGENYNFVYHLFKSHKAIKLAKENKNGDIPQKAWYGSHLLNDVYFIEVIRELLNKLLLADNISNTRISCYGFKEIRYIEIIDELIDYINFLKIVFPDAAFIFNFRNKNEVVKSGWWKNENKKDLKESLKKFEETCLAYMKENQESCFIIKYEDVVNKTQKLKDLFTFLGAEYNVNEIDHILSLPHSYDPQQKRVKEIFDQYPPKNIRAR